MPSLRKAIFYAVCIGIACWYIPTLWGERNAAERSQFTAPERIDAGCVSGARLLPRFSDDPLGESEHIDPQVRPASVLTQSLFLAQAAMAADGAFAITELSQGTPTITWPIQRDGDEVRLFAAGDVTLTGTGAAEPIDIKVKVGEKDPVDAKPTEKQGSWKATVPIEAVGEHKIVVTKGVGPNPPQHWISVLAPSADDTRILEPIISKVSNNAYKEPVDLSEVRVYGGYLKLAGLRVRSGTQLQFAVFDNSANRGRFLGLTVPSAPVVPREDASWEAELDMPLPPEMAPAPGFVLAMAFSATGGLHRYSATRVNFQAAPISTKLKISAAPLIRKGDDTEDLPKKGDVYLSKDRRFVVSGVADGGDASLLEDSRIVISLNGVPLGIKGIGINPAAKNRWFSPIEVDTDSKYTVEAWTVLGRQIFGTKSPAATVRVRTTGPSVLSVSPTNAAFEGIKVTFDDEINVPAAADLGKAFLLVNSSNKPSIDPQTAAASLPKFDPSDNSVTLAYQDVPPDVYTFTVKAGLISDLFGRTMAKDYAEKLFRPIGAEEPVISRGITGPTGPNVSFPEYTKPRPIIDGFNPSDHVETRVSRLYYFRDAHRVAQIINRDVKSYNRAAVDMQQQLADKARQIAEQATDQRREKERGAVEAAKKTREAERELQEAEALAANTANQAASAAVDQQRADAAMRNRPAERTDQEQADLEKRVENLNNVVAQLERVAESARNRAASAYAKVQALREQESAANEQWQASLAAEDRAREEQFRREVAAAHADPDTYAPGKPESEDPVRQVSVSVIGEGLIQLRGPIKGINVIRTMINQIDAPVGQVRIAVHTVQINGEKGDRMERVAGRIQRFIDHSRFLTLQSAEMLRKAIVTVAAQRAMELGELPGMTQEERDRKYLYSFFGDDFIRELEVMDSEFLQTGNKLLSLHSMDSTSLASAMFIMALAKNTTRLEILQTFDGMMAGELPLAEQNYFEAGLTCDGKHRLFDGFCKRDDFQLLSANARFQSIRGLFDAEIAADDTMTPIQREFVRLAQIFKSRLIVEMELKQRIMERSVIEERLGNRQKELEDAKNLEDDAKRKLSQAVDKRKVAQRNVLLAAQTIQAKGQSVQVQAANTQKKADEALRDAQDVLEAFLEAGTTKAISANATYRDLGLSYERLDSDLRNKVAKGEDRQGKYRTALGQISEERAAIQKAFLAPLQKNESISQRFEEAQNRFLKALTKHPDLVELPPPKGPTEYKVRIGGRDVLLSTANKKTTTDEAGRAVLKTQLRHYVADGDEIRKTLAPFEYSPANKQMLEKATAILDGLTNPPIADQSDEELLSNLQRCLTMFELYSQLAQVASEKAGTILRQINQVVAGIGAEGASVNEAYKEWLCTAEDIDRFVGSELKDEIDHLLEGAAGGFQALLAADLEYQFAQREAESARRPLDHKKFLDMLVDEMEDKYIELLEGTRAHTANIDAYIKRLMTSLDDDFNTQFYYPTFRKVREASQFWDVQMGQVETTNVLANNRAFAKVTPEATMEFDLPKRDIMIAEAIDGAKAMIDDVGALAQDPTFLAMAKLNGGQPTSSPIAGASGGFSTVRNVLPGLSTETSEAVLGQQGPGGAQFGAALEGLIPDPAIYKFETGTGWEIRPVIQPDGQAVVFHFNYMYSTNIREPIRADEKHLGRVKRHFVDTDVQLSNYELREVSRYTVALKAARTARGVPLLEDIPVAGVLFRPLPSAESSLQQNIIMSQATIFPTLFDLMGLRWAPVVADLDPLRLSNDEFIVRNRRRALMNRVFDHSSSQVDEFLRIPEAERRMDLYRSQETIPSVHPNGYAGPGANLQDSQLQEGYSPVDRPETRYVPAESAEGSPLRPQRPLLQPQALPLDAPQSGGDRGSRTPSYDGGSERIEQLGPPAIGTPLEAVPVPAPSPDGQALAPRRTAGGEVAPASYLQPVPQTPLLRSAPPSARTQAPLPPGQAELRRLPLVHGNARSN